MFCALFFVVPSGGEASCDGTTTRSEHTGTLSDGSGSSSYSNNANCSWIIAPSGSWSLTIKFTVFDVQAGYDFVRVYSCESEACASPMLLQYVLGLDTVVAPLGIAKITFTSDGSATQDGFNATWNFVPACNSSLGEYSWDG
eukprot:1690211-Rhodomonas_salina.1